ncbi:MAG TPA: DUF2844 domain-containing protein [Burkholderiales bacterium]|nr:DUF2844 domain-containing protein [Burkholderiales bacterium]
MHEEAAPPFGRPVTLSSGRHRVIKSASILLAVASLALPCAAHATLGEDVQSIASDSASMNATATPTQAAKYAVHEIRAASGTLVREFVSQTGKVFAIAWQGPVMPDLRQILGSYFDRYERAAKSGDRRNRGVNDPDLVVQSRGHMRAFTGMAYLPQLMPAGVSVDEIQ